MPFTQLDSLAIDLTYTITNACSAPSLLHPPITPSVDITSFPKSQQCSAMVLEVKLDFSNILFKFAVHLHLLLQPALPAYGFPEDTIVMDFEGAMIF